MATDLIYHSLRNAIIHSYQSGDMDNSMGQMNISLSVLHELYDPVRFHTGKITAEKIKLLTDVQTEVDFIMSQ